MIRYLVKKGIEVNAADPDAPISPLSVDVMTNDVPTARALIGAGEDVNNLDSVGSTPLLHAASVDFGDTEMVRLLLAGWRENGSAFRGPPDRTSDC